jgi:glycosyltransferase involved in cell wall biosynthesis
MHKEIGLCILTYNSSLTISHVLQNILKQDYPKEKILYLIVDGGSRDETLKIVNDILSGYNVDYRVVVAPGTNIPQARNICLENLSEESIDFIIFIDSDILLVPVNVLSEMIRIAKLFPNTIIHFAYSFKWFKDVSELKKFVAEMEQRNTKINVKMDNLKSSLCAGMGCTLIPASLAKTLHFYEKANFSEDILYVCNAVEKGYVALFIEGFSDCVVDLNVLKDAKSDIYWMLPIKGYLRGIEAKALIQLVIRAMNCGRGFSAKRFFKFIAKHLGNAFLLATIPITLALVLMQNFILASIFAMIMALSILGYATYKHVHGYPIKRALVNKIKFELFSTLVILLTPITLPKALKVYTKFKRLSKSIFKAS